MKHINHWLLLILALFTISAEVNAARYALVIGNSSYQDAPLKNPVNDANDIAAALNALNFNVTTKTNLNRRDFAKAVRDFGRQLGKDDVGLFYYAGHGMQVKGRNYLIPVNSEIEEEDEVEFNAIDANSVLAKMESAGNSINIVILDACRNNPFARSFRSNSRGLARMEAPTGSMVIYATGADAVAADGSGRNGLFTASLLNHISIPGQDLDDILRNTRADVIRHSDGKQVPWSSSSMTQAFYFQQVNTSTSAQTQHMGNLSAEELARWQNVRACTDANALQRFVNDFPNGTFTPVAQNCLNNLTANQPIALYIDTIPSGAQVRILNITPPYQYGMALQANRYHIEVSKAGYQSKTQWFELSKNNQTLQVRLEQNQQDSSQQSAEELYQLGVKYHYGNGVTQDYYQAVSWYRKAAEQGYAEAQSNLGYMYENGYGVNKNYSLAVEWYRKAAEQGHARGQSNLGIMYEKGYGVNQDYNFAVSWYRKAAEQGYATAQANVG